MNHWRDYFSYTKQRFKLNGDYAKLHQQTVLLLLRLNVYKQLWQNNLIIQVYENTVSRKDKYNCIFSNNEVISKIINGIWNKCWKKLSL